MANETFVTYPIRLNAKLMKQAKRQADLENRSSVADLIRHSLTIYLADKKTEAAKAVSA